MFRGNYCPVGHSYNNNGSIKESTEIFDLCIKKHFIQEFETCSWGMLKLLWIPYDNFRDIKHIADGGYGSVWEYSYMGAFALKEINYSDPRNDISKFLKGHTSRKWYLEQIAYGLINLHTKKSVHRGKYFYVLENDSILKSDNKILVENGNQKTTYDTHLIFDICNGVGPKIPDIIPKLYSDLMHKCWSSNPSERPTAKEIYETIFSFHQFGIWSSGNADVDEFVQESQKNYQGYYGNRIQWIPYDNFLGINHLANGGYGSVYSAILKNGIKSHWNLNKQDWEYSFVDKKAALKEINDSRHDTSKFLKEVKNLITADSYYVTRCFGISKNSSSQNYIIVMTLYNCSLHKLGFWLPNKIAFLTLIASGLIGLHSKNLVHRDLHSGNILVNHYGLSINNVSITDLGLCGLENDLILKSDNKSNNIYGSIPYIPPEVLRGNEFTKKGDIYSFGGIMYEVVTRKRPFYDRAHDTRLLFDICNGLRPKIPDIMLDYIPQCYSDFMYKCWSDNPSERPTAKELYDTMYYFKGRHISSKIDQLRSSRKFHPQSCYISRHPNSLKSNESTGSSISTYDIYSKEPQECFDWEKEIQNRAKNDHSKNG
ncbi:hypothetical protein Glove_311g26 [Diversispora epigaea]|uniref:Protein kinase domain-containing protein n=1 Tax=Diversispora epigaea TaxID=1348612 RepID=A0A397HYV5_9GLOM|nr:hypothetical protein Glove_311g26 [Diversispora epigaea]